MREIPLDEAWIRAMRNIITFRFLDDAEARDLSKVASVMECAEGEIIVQEGEVSPYFYGIAEGPVSVSVAETAGKQVFVSALGPGDVFGEAGIFMKVKRTATVSALERVVVIRFHRGDIIRFIRQYPEAGNKIMLVIVFGLLRKLKMVNQELAYERKSDLGQDDIDAMMENLFSEGEGKG
jgi:CRP/FNR family transcriptional regulator, cyclic AMP receptor protein